MTSSDTKVGSINMVIKTSDECHDPEILKFTSLNSFAARSRFTDFVSDVEQKSKSTINLVDSINGVLASTNSNRYYLGAEAVKRINDIKMISELINNVNLSASDVDIDGIVKTVEDYNTHLAEKKKRCRLYLLNQACENYNKTRKIATRVFSHSTPEDTFREKDIEENGYIVGRYEEGGSYHVPRPGNLDEGEYFDEYFVDVYKITYDIIRYKEYSENIQSLEMFLRQKGLDLPYGVVAL